MFISSNFLLLKNSERHDNFTRIIKLHYNVLAQRTKRSKAITTKSCEIRVRVACRGVNFACNSSMSNRLRRTAVTNLCNLYNSF